MARSDSTERLDALAHQVAGAVPTLDVRVERLHLVLRRGRRIVGKLGPDQIGRFNSGERTQRRRDGSSYADIRTGELFVDEPGLVLFVQAGTVDARLTPQQCAVLAAVLEADQLDWLRGALALEPGVLREELYARTGLRLTAPSISKLRKALTSPTLLQRGKLSPARVVDAILSDFKLDAVGRAVRLSAPARGVEDWIRAQANGARVVEGVAGVLREATGAVIEPIDVLVDRPVALHLADAFGGPVATGFRGPSIVVRGVSRLSLGELAPFDAQRVSPLLAVADAANSDAPIVREAAAQLIRAWRKRWK